MKSGHLLLLGTAVGLLIGLLFAWVIAPVEYYDTYPPLLQPDYRRDWIRMTALTYGQEGNWPRTQIRLHDLAEAEIRQTLARTLDEAVEAGHAISVLQRIAQLAQRYGVDNVTVQVYTREITPTPPAQPSPTPQLATPTAMPPISLPTPTPSPTLAPPTPTPSDVSIPPAFAVISQTLTCAAQPQIGVSLQLSETVTERGRDVVQQTPLPGMEIWLLSAEHTDRAITGFKPAQGLGYADFVVEPGQMYNLYIGTPTGAPAATLQIGPCTPEEGGGWLTHHLILQKEVRED